MKKEYEIVVEGQTCGVVVSDENKALLAAGADGRAFIGLWRDGRDLPGARYVVESEEVLTQDYLERVVRRTLGLPWHIAETKRLLIREFQPGDEKQIPKEPEDREADAVFRSEKELREYIRCQYGFFQYGIWAVVHKKTGKLVGKAGVANLQWTLEDGGEQAGRVSGLELGYHIFAPYRRKGYGREACQAVLAWCREELDSPKVYAKIDASNEASIHLARKLGFRLTGQKYIESGQCRCLYEWNCQGE